MILLAACILLLIAYSVLIIYYWQGWKSVDDFVPSGGSPATKISVIIPARNEEDNIGELLQALEQQTYSREFFEVIVVDDNSNDTTAGVVEHFPDTKLLRMNEDKINSYKKKAIETGIAAAAGRLIVTSDADCLPPPGWLKTIAAFKEEKNAVFIAAPVVLDCNSSLLQVFQSMDFMVLQGITAAAVHKKFHNMCNGANLAYERSAFYEVNGFVGIDHIASGDDMLLMHKIAAQYPGKIFYLKSKDVIVSTQPMKTWKEFFNQRRRWASKANSYNDKKISLVLILVYLFNFSFLVLFIAGWWNKLYWAWLAGAWVLKTLVELPFFYSLARFFDKQWITRYFFFLQPLHIAYTIIAGSLGQFGKYEWKGRKVK
jgi:cellulose synthase/poly-beta-1,6-N-acetylglucosamine synthase-like glycosyltransferase